MKTMTQTIKKPIRTQIGRPIQTADDRDYTPEEIGMAI
jgi:hypothetical protein